MASDPRVHTPCGLEGLGAKCKNLEQLKNILILINENKLGR